MLIHGITVKNICLQGEQAWMESHRVSLPRSLRPPCKALGDWRWGECELGQGSEGGVVGGGVPAIFGHPTWPCPHMPRGPEADGCARPTCRTSFITLQIGGPDSQLLDVTCSCLIPEDICCGRVTSTLIQANLPLKAGGRTQ